MEVTKHFQAVAADIIEVTNNCAQLTNTDASCLVRMQIPSNADWTSRIVYNMSRRFGNPFKRSVQRSPSRKCVIVDNNDPYTREISKVSFHSNISCVVCANIQRKLTESCEPVRDYITDTEFLWNMGQMLSGVIVVRIPKAGEEIECTQSNGSEGRWIIPVESINDLKCSTANIYMKFKCSKEGSSDAPMLTNLIGHIWRAVYDTKSIYTIQECISMQAYMPTKNRDVAVLEMDRLSSHGSRFSSVVARPSLTVDDSNTYLMVTKEGLWRFDLKTLVCNLLLRFANTARNAEIKRSLESLTWLPVLLYGNSKLGCLDPIVPVDGKHLNSLRSVGRLLYDVSTLDTMVQLAKPLLVGFVKDLVVGSVWIFGKSLNGGMDRGFVNSEFSLQSYPDRVSLSDFQRGKSYITQVLAIECFSLISPISDDTEYVCGKWLETAPLVFDSNGIYCTVPLCALSGYEDTVEPTNIGSLDSSKDLQILQYRGPERCRFSEVMSTSDMEVGKCYMGTVTSVKLGHRLKVSKFHQLDSVPVPERLPPLTRVKSIWKNINKPITPVISMAFNGYRFADAFSRAVRSGIDMDLDNASVLLMDNYLWGSSELVRGLPISWTVTAVSLVDVQDLAHTEDCIPPIWDRVSYVSVADISILKGRTFDYVITMCQQMVIASLEDIAEVFSAIGPRVRQFIHVSFDRLATRDFPLTARHKWPGCSLTSKLTSNADCRVWTLRSDMGDITDVPVDMAELAIVMHNCDFTPDVTTPPIHLDKFVLKCDIPGSGQYPEGLFVCSTFIRYAPSSPVMVPVSMGQRTLQMEQVESSPFKSVAFIGSGIYYLMSNEVCKDSFVHAILKASSNLYRNCINIEQRNDLVEQLVSHSKVRMDLKDPAAIRLGQLEGGNCYTHMCTPKAFRICIIHTTSTMRVATTIVPLPKPNSRKEFQESEGAPLIEKCVYLMRFGDNIYYPFVRKIASTSFKSMLSLSELDEISTVANNALSTVLEMIPCSD